MSDFQELKSEVPSWNLYTDEKLVSKLDSFLNHMMATCETIHKNTEQTLYETNAVSIYLSDTFNALSNLSNKKFIENTMAPLEEPQIIPKEPKHYQEMTVEKKQENFQKALRNVIDAFGISNTDEEDVTLSKSNTMSMSTMFRTGDHLPFIIGSKAFAQDEFLGIVDRTDNIERYLRELDTGALGDDQSPTHSHAPNGQYANGSSSSNPMASTGIIAQPTSNLPPLPGATNRVAINNTTLGPPPPLSSLLEQYGSGGAGQSGGASRPPNPMGGRGGLLGEIAAAGQDRPANPMGGRANLLGEIAAAGQDRPPNPMGGRGNLLGEIAAAGQDRQERPPNPMGGRANLLGEIAAAGQDRQERPPNPMGGRGNLLGEIAAAGQDRQARPPNPMGGRGGLLGEIQARGQEREEQAPAPAREKTIQEQLNERLMAQQRGGMGQPTKPAVQSYDEEPVQNRRISDIKSNPLYQPIQPQQTRQSKQRLFDEDDEDGEVGNNDMFRSSNVNKKKFEGLLSNPLGGGPSTLGNPMLSSMTMGNANPFDPFGLSNPFMPFNPKSAQAQAAVQREEQKKTERDSMVSMANSSAMYEDNNKSQAYEVEKKEDKAPKGNRLTKLFEDSEEDEETRLNDQRRLTEKYRADIKPKEEPAAKPLGAGARVSKMFDDEDEDGGFLSKPTQPKKEAEKPQLKSKISEVEEDDDFMSKPKVPAKKEPIRQNKPNKSLFDDDDDDDVGPLKGGSKKNNKPEPKLESILPKTTPKKKGMFDDDDDDILEEKKEVPQKIAPPKKSLQTKKSLFDDDDAEPAPKPVIRQEPKPVIREEPKPVIREEPKPVIREEPKPVYVEPPKPVVQEQPKPAVVEPPRSDFKPLADSVLEIKESRPSAAMEESWAGTRPAGNNLTQLIKAAQMAKKKKNSSDESSSGSDSDSAPPVRKIVTPVQTVVHEQPKVIEAPRVVEQPKIEPVRYEEKPVVREEEEVFSPVKNTRGGGPSTDFRKPSEEPEVKTEETHEHPHMSKQSSTAGVSSRISALQNQLNLNMMALKPGEGLPEHMRKAKLTIQHEEEQPATDAPAHKPETEAVGENGLSHMAALDKPAMQSRAKKTLLFEDDEEEEEIKKPVKSYNPPPAKVEPVYEEPRPTQPILKATSPFDDAPAMAAQRQSSKKKVIFDNDDEGDDPLAGFNNRKSQSPAKPTSSADDPMSLLKGLSGFNETNKSPSKKVTKEASRGDDDDLGLGLGLPKKQPSKGPLLMSESDPNNPLALLSGVKMMDEGRKSSKSSKSKGKSKGLFDDDDDGPPVLRPSAGPKVEESRPSTKAQPKSKLFNDSDEDGDFLKKKPAPISKPAASRPSKSRSKLFDDSD